MRLIAEGYCQTAARGGPKKSEPAIEEVAKEIIPLYLPKLQVEYFRRVKQLPSIADAYAMPESATFPGIDALHPSSGRMT